MPGKVNPVLPEVVNQICYQIIGSDLTVSMAAEAREFELKMAEPIIAYNLLSSLMLLKNAAIANRQSLRQRHHREPRALRRLCEKLHRHRHRPQFRPWLRTLGIHREGSACLRAERL